LGSPLFVYRSKHGIPLPVQVSRSAQSNFDLSPKALSAIPQSSVCLTARASNEHSTLPVIRHINWRSLSGHLSLLTFSFLFFAFAFLLRSVWSSFWLLVWLCLFFLCRPRQILLKQNRYIPCILHCPQPILHGILPIAQGRWHSTHRASSCRQLPSIVSGSISHGCRKSPRQW
jgi:hypothetical protein